MQVVARIETHFREIGKYGIPEILPEYEKPAGRYIPISDAMAEKQPKDKIVHSFVDDYRFERFWNHPFRYLHIFRDFKAVCAPDFSTFTNIPLAQQIFNHYRKHWVGAYWQSCGITVYPTISWSDEDSYEWCFDGEPCNSVVAVSSVGTQVNPRAKYLFEKGYNEMLNRLDPKYILFYGRIPDFCKDDDRLISINPFYDKITERKVVAKLGKEA